MATKPTAVSPLEDPNLEVIPAPEAQKIAATTVKPMAARGIAPTREDLAKRATELGVDPTLAQSFFSQESSGNWNSKDSPKGARGGMQVMPGTFKAMMGTADGQDDPWRNMEAGLRYINYGQRTLKTKDPELLAAGYHAGYDHPDLKAGKIPNTNDGMISTADYARSVAGRSLGTPAASANRNKPMSSFEELNKAEPDRYEVVDPTQLQLDQEEPGRFEVLGQDEAIQFETNLKTAADKQAAVDGKPMFDYLKDKATGGFDSMAQSLAMARWAVAGGDAKALSEQLAKQFADQAAEPKSTGEKEIDKAFKDVTDANGAWDTTKKGANALWTAVANPKALAGEVVGQAANAMPTIGAGAAGAGAGAGVGAAVGAPVGGVGAIPGAIAGAMVGGRAGMAAGTTATELGGEVTDMIGKRLADANQAPTAQNILALLNDKAFQSEALKQGTKKGLTVAAIDQVFMGIGGKIATAPVRREAAKQLAEQGVDVSTAAARKAALASPAGRAAVEAAKPSVAARVGAGAAATGVDSAGEVIGEGVSQQVARGEVDYGDALREGVASLGQSVVEPVIGGAMESGKAAVAAARSTVQPVLNAPSTASGPLSRAAENAAVQPDRITATAPDGSKVTGTVTGTSEDGKVQIVSDDGEVLTFQTGPNGVKIEQEAPNTPLSNALEVAAADAPEQSAAVEEQVAQESAPEQTADVAEPAQAAIESEAEEPAQPVQQAAPEQPPALNDMDEPALRARLKYLGDQARSNGGWNQMLVKERRRVEKEINARVKAAAPVQPALDLQPATTKGITNGTETAQTQQAEAQREEAPKVAPAPAKPLPPTDIKLGDKVLIDGKPHTVTQGVEGGIAAESDATDIGSGVKNSQTRILKGDDAIRAKIAADESGLNAKAPNAKALDRIARGTAYFGSKPKAAEWIAKSGLSDTHEVVKHESGANRWDVRAKATVKDSLPVQSERETRIESVIANGGHVVGVALRDRTGMRMMDLTPEEIATIPEDKVRAKPDAENARTQQEPTNVNDNNPVGKPASTEEVGQEADAASTPAATVQPEAAAKEEVATEAKPGTVNVPKSVSEALTSQLQKQKGRITRLRNEAEKAGSLEDKKAAQLKVTAAEATLRKMRTSIFDAEDAAVKATETGDPSAFAEYADLFPGAAQALADVSKNAQVSNTSSEPVQKGEDSGQVEPTDPTPPTSGGKPDPFAKNKLFTSDAVAKARARLKSKLTQINSGIDPEMVMDGMTIAGAYIESGTRTFAAYAKAMVEDLGDQVKPYLLSFYEAARHYPGVDSDGMSSPSSARAQHEALMLDFAETQKAKAPTGTTENENEPAKLDQPGPRELEGKQPDAVQGAEPQRKAGDGTERRSGADARGNDGAGSQRAQQPGSMGNDAREVPVPAGRAAEGRGGKSGGEAVQPGKRAAKRDTAADRGAGNQPDLIPESGNRAQDRADGFVITEDDAIGEGGQKTKFKQNVAAIRLLKQLETDGRPATRAEQAVLAKYVGWGGIPQAFYRDNNEVTKGWEKEAAELKSLMTEAELAAAAASTRNAHYTSPEVVTGLWDAVQHFGFQGGRTLEPSVGVGNFFGLMPTALRSASQLTGVELDHVTGGIAKQLYPNANIQAPVGFQDFTAPAGYFDLAIGNPPFGAEGIYDPRNRKISGFSIHNYFFAKSIDMVKPNGVLAMVVTNRLLDKVGDKERNYIAQRAEFLGAIRLPNNAFAKNAGTEVTTDIIFLRKLKDGEQPGGQAWGEVKQYKDANGKLVPLNEYFVRNPDMMLGEFGQYGSMYREDDSALIARPGQDTAALMQEAIAKLPRGFMDAPTAAPALETIEPMHDVSHVKVGSVFEQGGQIFERREDMLGKQQAAPVTFASDKANERVTGMIQVRDALIAVRGLQLTDGVNEKALEAARADLNKAYDAFVKANGPLNADANKRLMRDDPTWPQIAALEDGFDKGISATVAKATGEKARAPSARKSAIFTKRTQSPYKAPESAKSAKDALVSSMAERGRVDLDYMASLYDGHTPEAIAKELDGLIFKNPAGGWESRDQYLSGNVKKKLAQAIDAAKADQAMRANVDALKAVQPADIEAVDIDAKTGAHWVPADVMQNFIEAVSGGERARALYNPVTATWTLSVERPTAANVTEYSTDRVSLTNVLEAAANQKQIVVRDKHYDGTTTVNEAATTAANAKVERVKAEWKNWLWTDDARRERLARIYNDTFNTDVQREFDGSHLTFPGKVGNDIIQLRPHQANAVWRMVQSGTTLLDHVVGAGKTFTMIAGIMEMRRMGLAKKPMLAVPNHLVGQWAEDFMKLYPGANILAATKKDFEKDNRKKLFARIATGDWDAVIVAHSSFGKVEVEPEFQEAFIKQQIADMDTSIASMRAAEGKSSRNVKQIEKQKANLEEKLKKLFDTGSKDDNLYFSELGVDAVLLDEAHEFKNLGFSTGMQRVAGLGNPAGSNKAADMFMKIQSTLARTGGKNVVFATGTPISNTMAEMYTMQRYLDYPTLKDQGIAHFDAWAKTFGEVVTDWELSPSGQYKMNSRFAKFVNMPELMQRYQSFADVVNRDDINRMLASQGKKLPVPKIKGGKPENTVVERSQAQALYIGIPTVDDNGVEKYPEGSLIYRSENLPKKAEKGADNMLKIMSDARKAALDMRLIDPNYPDNPASKVNVSADNIKAIYDQWTPDKGAQLVFIDLSTPKSAVAKEAAALRDLVAKAEEGDEAAQEKLDAMSPDELLALDSKFSVYDDLKAKLIARGIPENEIAFIHDANTELQKEDLFGKVRSGRVRVLFGSTAKMGAGMNVQERLVALHHLDAPWRPSDLEQREGRIIRQGNKLYDANPDGFEIQIKRYATKQTLDSRMWQTIEAKARFIEQVRKGSGAREVEDVAGEAANSAEMKAASSGNPLILEEMSLRQAIRKLENEKSEHDREQYRIKDRIRWANDYAAKSDIKAAEYEADAPLAPKEFAVKIGNQTFDKHGEAGQAILDAVNAMFDAGKDSREIGSYGGFKLTIDDTSTGLLEKRAVLTIDGKGSYQIEANPGSAATGLALRLQNTVKTLKADADQARAAAARERAEVPKLEAKIKPWGASKELADAKTKHTAVIEQLKPKKKPEAAKPEAKQDDAAFAENGESLQFNPELPRGTVLEPTQKELDLDSQIVAAEKVASSLWNEGKAKRMDAIVAELSPRAEKAGIDAKTMQSIAQSLFFKDGDATPEFDAYRVANNKVAALRERRMQMVYDRLGPPEFDGMQQLKDFHRPITETDNFKRWFKGSKVVDQDGRPLIALHGTNRDFTQFRTTMKGDKQVSNNNWMGELGSWFAAPSPHSGYEAGSAEATADTFAELRGGGYGEISEGAAVYPVYLSIKKPYETETYEDVSEQRDAAGGGKAFREKLIAEGYDGIVVRESDTDGGQLRDDWIAFYPEQIKSAIGNNGQFDPANPDIRFDATSGWGKIDADNIPTLPTLNDEKSKRDIALLTRKIDGHKGLPALKDKPFRAVRLPDAGSLAAIGEAFGVDPVGFDLVPDAPQAYDFFSGVTFKASSKVVFLGARASRPHLALLGHETAHQLRAQRPDLYNKLVDAVSKYVDVAKYEGEFVNSPVAVNVKTADGKQEEFMGEVLSDAFMDPTFWQTLAKEGKSVFKNVYNIVLKLLGKLAGTEYAKKAAPYLTDYDRVMQIAGEVLAELEGKPVPPKRSLFGLTFAEKITSIPAALTSNGYTLIPRGNERRFKEFGTWEKDGVRVALSGNMLSLERGAVIAYPGEGEAMTIEAIIADASERGKGRARAALQDITRGADETGKTLYLEPVQLEKNAGLNRDQLVKFYGSAGFKGTTPDNRVMVREPSGDAAFAEKEPAAPQGLTPPEQGLLRRIQASVQNNMNRVRQVQDAIEKRMGRKLPEYADYYGAETNRPGRIAARLEDAKAQLTGPLMEKLAKSGYTAEQLDELLHAQHAEERNIKVAEINPEYPDGGSGMTTDEAKAILAKYSGNRKLQDLASDARNIARSTLELKLAYGLIDQDAYDAMTNSYKAYVPLKGTGEYGPKIKKAMGHDERAEHILENIARDYDQAVVSGERNLARQSLLQMVLKNPDSDLWTVGVPPKGRYIAGQSFDIYKAGKKVNSFDSAAQAQAWVDGRTDGPATYIIQTDRRKFIVERDGVPVQDFYSYSKAEDYIAGIKDPAGKLTIKDAGETVREFVKPLQDNEVMVYVDGQPVRIQIADEKLASQLRPLNQGQMNPILEFMRTFNRYLSQIYTGKNPAFILRNAARDAITGSINMVGNEGAVTAAKAWAHYPSALKTLGQWSATGNTPDSQMGKYMQEYRSHGGKTGASWMSDLEEQGKTLQRMYDDAYGASGYLADGKPGKAALIAGRKIVGGMAHVVEIANVATENALRLALYTALRKDGVSAGKAAQAAKSVTVDFDRKGSMTGALGAIYLFMNPAIQGTANALKTLTKGEHKKQAWAALGMLGLLGLYAASQGLDDDKDRWLGEGWESRSKNFILNIGGKRLKVPMSQEFAPFYAFGVAMAEAMRGESKMKSAAHIISSMIDAYFPLQGAYSPESDNHGADLMQAAIPTILKPGYQSATNRNTFGSQIVPENDFTKDRIDNQKMFRGTKGSSYDAAAQGIAKAGDVLTGAGSYENSLSKVSPETLKHIVRTYTGGLGTFIADSIGVARMAFDDASQVEKTDVPIIKDFVKANDVSAIRGRFYDLSKGAKSAAEEFKQAKKAGDGEAIDKLMADPEKSALLGLDKLVKHTSQAAAKLRDQEVDINSDKSLSLAEKRAALKDLQKAEEELYRSALEAFK